MEFKDIIARAVEIKARYEGLETKVKGKAWSNEENMMGLVVDVGELTELVMAKEGARVKDDVDAKLAHELSDCLWCILVLSQKYGVDIEAEFLKTMDSLEVGIKRRMSE